MRCEEKSLNDIKMLMCRGNMRQADSARGYGKDVQPARSRDPTATPLSAFLYAVQSPN